VNKSQSIALSNYQSACDNFSRIIKSDNTQEQRQVAESECRERYAQLINTVELDYSKNETISAAMLRTFPGL
jgi:hypothetical protein